MSSAKVNLCSTCGAVLAPKSRPVSRSGLTYCDSCTKGIRDGVLPLLCKVCNVAKPAVGNFRASGQSLTGYISTCRACQEKDRDPNAIIVCTECHEYKRADSNYHRTTSYSGYGTICKVCLALPWEVRRERRLREEEERIKALPPEEQQAILTARQAQEAEWRRRGEQLMRVREEQQRQAAREQAARDAALSGARMAVRLTCRECGEEKVAWGNFLVVAAARTGYRATCTACIEKAADAARVRTETVTCYVCERTLPAAENFRPDALDTKDGYTFICHRCVEDRRLRYEEARKAAKAEMAAILGDPKKYREWLKATAVTVSYSPHERDWTSEVRALVGQTPRPLPAGQIIYGLLDPRTDAFYYVGYTGNPKRRLSDHIKGTGDRNPDKDAWIAELHVAGLLPEIVVLEEVKDPATTREREDRWIYHLLHQGDPLTNWQAYFRHLAKAVRETEMDYLSAPFDTGGWRALVEAHRRDAGERRDGIALAEIVDSTWL